jgi:hypothetical protein
MSFRNDTSLTIERMLAPSNASGLAELSEFQKQLDKIQRVEWIQSMGPWDVMMTGTFRWEASMESGRRCFTKWIRRKLSRVSYYYVIEPNPSRDGFHVHSLWADARTVYRREMWSDWVKRYGRARIEPVLSAQDSADYASKYLTKPNCWWDCFLQWHRKHRVNGTAPGAELLPGANELPSRLQVDNGRVSFSKSHSVTHSNEADGQRAVGTDLNTTTNQCLGSVARERAAGISWKQTAPGIWKPHHPVTPLLTERPINETSA